jgi:hypothetical protein
MSFDSPWYLANNPDFSLFWNISIILDYGKSQVMGQRCRDH